MRIVSRRYRSALVIVSVVTMNPGDELPTYSQGDVLGGFLVYGSVAALVDGVEGSQEARLGWTPGALDGPWRLAWDDPGKAAGKARYRAGASGAQWVCLMGDRIVTPQLVEGRYTIPAGKRFVVARGLVEFDNQQGEQGLCFGPREIDKDVTGAADILLLT